MLKFLDDRPEDKSPKKSPIKYHPEMCYGNSFESPKEFQTPHTIFYRRSYINPFLKFQPQRAEHIQKDNTSLEPRWTHKVNLSMIEEQKILEQKHPQRFSCLPKSRYLQSFHQQFQADPQRFRITRGEFTNFIEKNNHYKEMGPMQGIQRTTDRITKRQQSVWIKQPSKREEMTASLRYASSYMTSIKSNIAVNSQMLTQKIRIRRSRDHIQKMFRRDLQKRKKAETSIKFQLPRSGPEHELYLLEKNISSNKSRGDGQEKVDMNELQKFQNKICRVFK